MICECNCGKEVPTAKYPSQQRHFINGHNKGGLRHGLSGRSEMTAYIGAKQHCTNPKHPRWFDYGGRGIKFLFTSFEQFITELGPKSTPQHSLDRINNDGNYEPGNVKWSTAKEQAMNKRKRGGTKTWMQKTMSTFRVPFLGM